MNDSTSTEILPSVLPPYLGLKSDKKYTLVLDLDETLIHYSEINGEGSF